MGGRGEAMMGHIVEAEGAIRGTSAASAIGTVTVGAEAWQFFAFMFAAVVSLAFALVDALPSRFTAQNVVLKVVAFAGLGYLTLFNWRVKYLLLRLLPVIKTKP
jgi:hypothetical protein